MKMTRLILQLYILMITITLANCFKVKQLILRKNAMMCRKMTKTKSFQDRFVMSLPWRTYYTWVTRLDQACMDMEFKIPQNTTINYFSRTYGKHVPTQLAWEEATLLAIEPEYKYMYQMLMVPMKGSPGMFQAVPDILQGVIEAKEREERLKEAVPIFKFGFKLFRKGLFLLRWDCIGGIGHLMARTNTVTKQDISSLVQALNFTTRGHPACVKEKEKKKTNSSNRKKLRVEKDITD